jgi:transcriptional regulator with XRE-family HTH domain
MPQIVTTDPHEIGRRIKAARIARGWTQLHFALQANVSPSSIARWEQGRLPPIVELNRISQVLGVPAGTLVGDATVGEEAWERLERQVADLHSDVRSILASLGDGGEQPRVPSERDRP